MSTEARSQHWLPSFRRALSFLYPHRRQLFIGLIAAIGVSVFYTFSISSVIPLLKVIFADHETLPDWLNRVETDRRLGIALAQDAEDDPRGLVVLSVRPDSRSSGVLKSGDRIIALDGVRASSYQIMRTIAMNADKDMVALVETQYAPASGVVQESVAAGTREVTLRLRSYHWWSNLLRNVARILPSGKDASSRLLTLGLVMAALVLVSILGGLCRLANEGMVATAVQKAMHDFRSHMASHVLHLPLEWHTAQPPGDTISRFAADLPKVEVGVMTLFGKVIREPLKAVGVLTLTILIDWKMLLIALIGLPVGALVMALFGRTVKRAQKRASKSWGRLIDHLGEKLAGIRVVKAYGMQDAETDHFEKEGRELTRAQTHIELVDAATNPALETLAMIGVAAFMLYGGSRVFNHQLESTYFFAATICLAGVFDPVRKMGNVNNRLQAAEVASKRLFDLLDLPAEEPRRFEGAPLRTLEDSIEFRDVSFSYPTHPQKAVVDQVNLQFKKGQVVALVGPNGSGKTTLMSLLLRFYEPTRGGIYIDGQNIGQAALESLRGQIGLVTQDSVVFSDTIYANIAYGANGAATPGTVERAARMAHIDDFIQTLKIQHNGAETRGYDAFVTSRSLSGGQKQRIALARAILRDPPILILDEATSQIDSESERKIQEALEDVTRDRTTFIIAHRFSTISRADVIVVLNEGRVIACGVHNDLMKTCPFYVNLCHTQFAQPL